MVIGHLKSKVATQYSGHTNLTNQVKLQKGINCISDRGHLSPYYQACPCSSRPLCVSYRKPYRIWVVPTECVVPTKTMMCSNESSVDRTVVDTQTCTFARDSYISTSLLHACWSVIHTLSVMHSVDRTLYCTSDQEICVQVNEKLLGRSYIFPQPYRYCVVATSICA